MTTVEKIGQQAKEAAQVVAQLSIQDRNQILLSMAEALREQKSAIMAAN
ncbi:Gamma-glutamyl phosphate reductase (ProA) [Fructobacillus cardui]|nr:Gamma-glutamyl phosphate reductase (ProA) [Fructobacillus cardui]